MSDRIHDTVSVVMSGTVAPGGTFTASYPSGKSMADYAGSDGHQIVSTSGRTLLFGNGDFSISFGAANMTVTVLRGNGFATGETIFLNLDRAALAPGEVEDFANPAKMADLTMVRINLGAPATADANGVVESQGATAAGGLGTGINGALATDGVATFDVPRNVVAAWTGTAVLTVTGTDEYGAAMTESSASGTSLAGKKAFKTITSVTTSADITGLTVGSGDVLGLPVFLAEAIEVILEIEDGASATSGTIVVGATATPTATTGDVRGTYDPNSAANGSRRFELLAALRSPAYKGLTQYAA